MKKSVFTLAVMTMLAGAAAAQSSVTLFGVVDANGRWLNNDGVKQYSLSQGGLSTSRLGVRGSEDLGGGLRAGFWLEGQLDPDTGTPGGQTWQRRSTLSLSGEWGEFRLGRDYTATYWNVATFNPFGVNGVGSAGNFALRSPGVPDGGAYDTLSRASNMIGYFIPAGTAGGLYGQLQVAAGENVNGNKFFGGRIGYASNPFNVAVAYGRTEVLASPQTDGDSFNIAGAWSFGFMTLSAFYGEIKVGDNKQDNWFVGAIAPLGVWTLKASYGEVRRSGTTPVDIEGQKARQYALGAVYDLSKRTALYGTWSGLDNTGGAKFVVSSLNNVAGGGAAANADSQGLELGIKHSF